MTTTTRVGSWWDSYRGYLASPAWQAVRTQVLARDQDCTVCITYPATHAHYLSYAHVGGTTDGANGRVLGVPLRAACALTTTWTA
jgi:hypothetical protein